jgi:GrpB-like predicted nucleotidyltransferase (UPF0157 family)
MFQQTACALRAALCDDALRLDHIGSTAVPGLAAKPVIDMQLTVRDLAKVAGFVHPLMELGFDHRAHITCDRPPDWDTSGREHWDKAYFRRTQPDTIRIHLHVREYGRLNQRYPLLMRDYLRADETARNAYALFKQRLSTAVASVSEPGGTGPYLDLKDPFFDLLAANAEDWAIRASWSPGASDA